MLLLNKCFLSLDLGRQVKKELLGERVGVGVGVGLHKAYWAVGTSYEAGYR